MTWDALSKDTTRFGETLLRNTIDTVKFRVTGTNLAPTSEAASYPLIVVDYLAKLVALELITPGIDFWMSEPISESATGTNENHVFTDRAEALRLLRDDLLDETRRLWPEVAPLITFRRLSAAPRPRINTMDDEFLTPSPQEFPRPYRVTERS